MKEEWKIIPETNDNYEVSSLGRVRRLTDATNTFAGKELKPSVVSGGYLGVDLPSAKSKKGFSIAPIHGLVAKAFLGAKPKGLQVNHKDGDKKNNTVENLEYVTPLGNTRHYLKLGLKKNFTYGETNGQSKLTQASVDKIKELWATKQYKQDQLATMFNTKQYNISKIVNDKRWKVRTPGK